MTRQERIAQDAITRAHIDNEAAKEKATDESEKVKKYIIKFCRDDYNFDKLCQAYDITPDELNKNK